MVCGLWSVGASIGNEELRSTSWTYTGDPNVDDMIHPRSSMDVPSYLTQGHFVLYVAAVWCCAAPHVSMSHGVAALPPEDAGHDHHDIIIGTPVGSSQAWRVIGGSITWATHMHGWQHPSWHASGCAGLRRTRAFDARRELS